MRFSKLERSPNKPSGRPLRPLLSRSRVFKVGQAVERVARQCAQSVVVNVEASQVGQASKISVLQRDGFIVEDDYFAREA